MDSPRIRDEESSIGARTVPVNSHPQALAVKYIEQQSWTPTLLLLEQRDEVFARLASDLAGTGLTVIRATDVASAYRECSRREFDLVVANVDLPAQDVWGFARQLQRSPRSVCLWLYKSRRSAVDVSRAYALGVDELIGYGGDVFELSDVIVDCLAGRSPKPSFDSSGPGEHRKTSAAA